MSRVIEIRQSVDGVLDRWQVKVEAMETLLDASQDQVLDKLEASKQAYVNVIDKVKVGIADSQSLAEAEKDRLQQRLDEARVQIALGKADTIDAFNEQRQKLSKELAHLEKEVDVELAAFDEKVDEVLDEAAQDLVQAGNALDAQLEATAVQLLVFKDTVKSGAETKIAQAREGVAALKANVAAVRKDAPATIKAFETEFTAGWDQMVSAFKNLV